MSATNLRATRQFRRASVSTPGTLLTNTVTETVLGSVVIPGMVAIVGCRIKFRGFVKCILSHSTDTLQVKVRIGNTTLTGTAIITSAAVDVANNDICQISGELTLRQGPGANADYVGEVSYVDFAGTTVVPGTVLQTGSTGLDTSAAWFLEVTGKWSVADAGNSCELEDLEVEIFP